MFLNSFKCCSSIILKTVPLKIDHIYTDTLGRVQSDFLLIFLLKLYVSHKSLIVDLEVFTTNQNRVWEVSQQVNLSSPNTSETGLKLERTFFEQMTYLDLVSGRNNWKILFIFNDFEFFSFYTSLQQTKMCSNNSF
jgi:hypothetical protein